MYSEVFGALFLNDSFESSVVSIDTGEVVTDAVDRLVHVVTGCNNAVLVPVSV